MRAAIPCPRRVRGLLRPSQFNCIQMHVSHLMPFYYCRLDPLDSFPQQFLCILMHAGQLLGDGVLWPVLLLRQALDPPDLGEELADLLGDVPAILLGHGLCGSVFLMAFHSFSFKMLKLALQEELQAGSQQRVPSVYPLMIAQCQRPFLQLSASMRAFSIKGRICGNSSVTVCQTISKSIVK